MPRMDGLELIRNVRDLYPDIHCILLTAYSEFSYAKEAISLGVENYLLKPVSKEEVVQTVTKALDNIYKHHEIRKG
jgi:two-component system response regulator YesN